MNPIDFRSGLQRVLLLLVGFCLGSAAVSSAEGRQPRREHVEIIRFGYVTFDEPYGALRGDDAALETVKDYLRGVAERLEGRGSQDDSDSEGSSIYPVFEIAVGNYYQVSTWLRHGELDAAVVSPFTSLLLESEDLAEPVAELWRPTSTGDVDRGHWPYLTARQGDEVLDDPMEQFKAFLHETEHNAALAVDHFDADLGSQFDVRFVSHLSTTGFVAPMACAASWLDERLDAHTWSRVRRDRMEEMFWKTLLRQSRFRFGHSDDAEMLGDHSKVILEFTYRSPDGEEGGPDGEPPSRRPVRYSPSSSCGLDEDDGSLSKEPIVPDDVVVITAALARRLKEIETLAKTSSGEDADWRAIWLPPNKPLGSGSGALDEGYREVHPLDEKRWERFESEVVTPFKRATMSGENWFEEWYGEERFPFLPGDLVRLLRHDQVASGQANLALVLPGGGVKSAYQSLLLDHLYRNHLTNAGRPAPGGGPEGLGDERLRVRHVIGTSGGAIVGLLTAMVTPRGEPNLADDWRGLESSFDVFPFFNLLRWLSVLLLLAIFWVGLALWLWLREPRDLAGRDGVLPFWPAVHLVGFAMLAPIVIAAVVAPDNGLSFGVTGFVYVLIVLLAHFGFCCLSERPGHEKRGHRLRLALWALTLGGAALAFSAAWKIDDLAMGVSAKALLVALVVLAVEVLHLAVAGVRGRWLTMPRVFAYLRGLGVVTAYISASYLLLFVLSRIGVISLLEMTTGFWIGTFLTGLVVAVLAVAAAGSPDSPRSGVRGFVAGGLDYMMSPDSRSRRLPSAHTAGLLFFGLAFFWWVVCLGHAMYGGKRSHEFLASLASTRSDGSPPVLYANLVVTGSVLHESCSKGEKPVKPGDVYFCFSGVAGCPPVGSPRWYARPRFELAQLLDVVFASGSAVPVFPERFVHFGDECLVPLVDGGFAHNEPLEAARYLTARQVLVVRSTPVLETPIKADSDQRGLPWPSRLARNLGRIFPFLFERSQQIDRSASGTMVVATLTPSGEHGEFPLLTDFRRPVVERLLDAAEKDAERLVGRVESWGIPRTLEWVRSPGEEKSRGYTPGRLGTSLPRVAPPG